MLTNFFIVLQGLSVFLVAAFIILAISVKLEQIEYREMQRRRKQRV